jgi:hypothetical protein
MPEVPAQGQGVAGRRSRCEAADGNDEKKGTVCPNGVLWCRYACPPYGRRVNPDPVHGDHIERRKLR